MSERDMEHMMMMMLHNAVTQVEMEEGVSVSTYLVKLVKDRVPETRVSGFESTLEQIWV